VHPKRYQKECVASSLEIQNSKTKPLPNQQSEISERKWILKQRDKHVVYQQLQPGLLSRVDPFPMLTSARRQRAI
jgi:hypothetical protein